MKQLIKDLLLIFLKYFSLFFILYIVLVFGITMLNLPLYVKDAILTLCTPFYGILFVMLRMKKRKMNMNHMNIKTSYSKECLSDTGTVLGIDIAFTWAASILLGLFIQVQSNIDMTELNNNLWISLLAYGILAPIDEEFFFRGYLMDELAHHDRLKAAVVLSIVFGLAHLNVLVAFAGFVISMCMFALRFKYDSVWPGILAHMGFNILNQVNAYLNTDGINVIDAIMICLILFSALMIFKKKTTIVTEFKELFHNPEKTFQNEEMCSEY